MTIVTSSWLTPASPEPPARPFNASTNVSVLISGGSRLGAVILEALENSYATRREKPGIS